jgi:hypothetical protein
VSPYSLLATRRQQSLRYSTASSFQYSGNVNESTGNVKEALLVLSFVGKWPTSLIVSASTEKDALNVGPVQHVSVNGQSPDKHEVEDVIASSEKAKSVLTAPA